MFETAVLEIESRDGLRKLEFCLLSIGKYQFTEWQHDPATGDFTELTRMSGLYETLDAAKAHAREDLPWFSDQT